MSWKFSPFTSTLDFYVDGVSTVASVGNSPTSTGATITGGDILTLQPADATHPGVVSTTTQTFAGNKTFTGSVTANVSPSTVISTGSTTSRTLANRFADAYNVKDYGAVGDGSTNDTTAIQNAINSAYSAGGGTVVFPNSSAAYAISDTVFVKSGISIDFLGNTVQMIGASTHTMFENIAQGSGTDTNIIFRNGHLIGNGATVGQSQTGAAITLFGTDQVVIENIHTESTSGDGFTCRLADNTYISNCTVTNFGRNGISPTSGTFWIDGFKVSGTIYSGANPGVDWDSENDNSSETTVQYLNNIEVRNMTFFDNYNATNFAHQVVMNNVKITGSSIGLKIQATNNIDAHNFVIGPTCVITASGSSPSGILIDNVNKLLIQGASIVQGTITGFGTGILINNTVSGLALNGVVIDPSFSTAIDTHQTSCLLNSSTLRNLSIGTVLLQGSSNTIDACRISSMTIYSVGSINNVFGADSFIASLSYSSGALASNQVLTNLTITGDFSAKSINATSTASQLTVGNASSASTTPVATLQTQAGGQPILLKLNNPANRNTNRGSAIAFYNPNGSGSSQLGAQIVSANADSTPNGSEYLAFFTGSAGTLAERVRIDAAGAVSVQNLTASQAVITDSSKNLTSLGYGSTNTVSTLVERDGSGNFSAGTITATLTGTASGNTTYSVNNHGVVLSSSTNAMTVVAPDASTSKVLISGGASADPTWSLLTNSSLSGSAAITNANLANMASSSSTVGTVKGNISGSATTPSDVVLTSANTASSAVYRDGSGNFSAGTITAALSGNATTATTSTNFSGNLAGDVTGPQGTTVVAKIAGVTVGTPTGTGNVVFSASPTFTGTIIAAAITASGTLTVNNATGIVLQNGSAATVGTFTNDTGFFAMESSAANASGIKLETNGAVALTIDNSQNSTFANSISATATTAQLTVGNASSASTLPVATLQTQAGGQPILLKLNNPANRSTDRGSAIAFYNPNGSGSSQLAAQIVSANADSSTNGAEYLAFFTGTGGTLAERMRINATGQVGIGVSPGYKLDVQLSTTSTKVVNIQNTDTTASSDPQPALQIIKGSTTNTAATNRFIEFDINAGATGSGFITSNGANAAAFAASSDARLKDNIISLSSQLDNIMNLRPVEFDYKDGSGHQIGFIAQEMQKIYPDSVASDSNTGMLSIAGWSKTEARLIKALQELSQKHEKLEIAFEEYKKSKEI